MYKHSLHDDHDLLIMESNKGVHTCEIWEGWEDDRDNAEVSCPRHWLDKCPQEGGFPSGRGPGRWPAWVEALPPGLAPSETHSLLTFLSFTAASFF